MSKDDEKKIVSLDQKRMEAFWGKPISIYTRAQALADGVLVDLTGRPRSRSSPRNRLRQLSQHRRPHPSPSRSKPRQQTHPVAHVFP